MTRSTRFVAAAVVAAIFGALLFALPARAAAPRYVATTGTDTGNDCLTQANPCLTIKYAVTQAVSGDTIVVAAGSYPELVNNVTKDLRFEGANVGIPAGVNPGVRGPESIVKGFRTGTPGSTQRVVSIDGFQIDPQGDSTLMTPQQQPLVWLYLGPGSQVVNNVFVGAATYVPNCSFTCTSMTDAALDVRSGTSVVSDNSFTNFRRPVSYSINSTVTPLTAATFTRNVLTNVTSRGLHMVQNAGMNVWPGITISDNVFDATGRTAPSSPAAITTTQRNNTITGNSITGFSSGVYVLLCRTWPQDSQTITGNTFTNNGAGVNVDDYSLTTTDGLTSRCYNQNPPLGGHINGSVITDNNFVGNTTAGVTGWSYTRTNPGAFQVTSITDVSNTSPIVITTSAANGVTTGAQVNVAGVQGNTAANGTWTVTQVSTTSFSLDGSAGNGAYVPGGAYYELLPLPSVPSPALDTTCNWWNSATGPSDSGPGTGDKVRPGFDFTPWRIAAAPGGACTGGTLAPTAVASAVPTSGTAPLAVAFDGTGSSDVDGTVVDWAWDFGDTNTGSGATVNHTYAAPGTYTVTLTVTDNLGATGTDTETVVVNPVSAADTVAINVAGGITYSNSGSLTSGNYAITRDSNGIKRVGGTGTIPSTVSGNATVSFSVNRFWTIPMYTGSVRVSDAGAGVSLNHAVFFSRVNPVGLTGATNTQGWVDFSRFPWRSYTMTWTVHDLV